MKNEHGKQWYVMVIMVYYFVVCGAVSISNVTNYFDSSTYIVPVIPLFLCLGMMSASGIYFYFPNVGRKSLMVLTSITLLAIGESDPAASLFHLVIILILCIPSLRQVKHALP